MDEIRFVAGPITQRYLDKVEAERQAMQKQRDEAEAIKRAEREAAAAAKKADPAAATAGSGDKNTDEDMKDAGAESGKSGDVSVGDAGTNAADEGVKV